MIGYYDYANQLTYLGVVFAVIGMHAALHNQPNVGIMCLMLAGICDMFDGTLARRSQRTGREQNFGIQIDSLADLISFGVLPVIIGYAAGMNTIWHALLHAMYVLAALIRLAYYNVTEMERKEIEDGPRTYYEGLPVTTIAILLPIVYLASRYVPMAFSTICTVLLPLTAAAFVSRIRIAKPKLQHLLAFLLLGAIVIKTILIGRGYYLG